MLLPLNSRLSLVSMAGALFLGGFTVGTSSIFAVYHHKLQQANATNASLLELTKAQSIMLAQASLPNLETGSSVIEQSAEPAAAAASTALPSMPVPPVPKQFLLPVPTGVPAAQLRAVKKSDPKPPAPAPVAAPPSAESAAALAGVTMEQAGIAGMDTAGVRFKSGRQINVGSEFPTGEKLLSVNPAEGRIVTDRRVITLIKPAPAL